MMNQKSRRNRHSRGRVWQSSNQPTLPNQSDTVDNNRSSEVAETSGRNYGSIEFDTDSPYRSRLVDTRYSPLQNESQQLQQQMSDNESERSLSDISGDLKKCSFTSLPDDVLFLIFKHLEPEHLCSLCCTCRRLHHLASKDTVWIHHAEKTAVFKNSLNWNSRQCSAKELCRVAPNWRLGRFKEGFAVKHRKRFIPWVHKNDTGLWFSTGKEIHFFTPQPSGQIREEKDKCLESLEEDITRFTVKRNMLVSGCSNGSVYGWDTSGTLLFCYKQVHQSETQCVDLTDRVVVSGSKDATCKILSLEASPVNDGQVIRSFEAGERVWSLKIAPCQRFFAAGLAGCLDDPPVVMWDMESGKCLGQLSENHRRGAGVLDLKFESPHELLTCGYDTFLKMWDLRTQKCVAQWEEPHDSALYCIESDGRNSLVVGTARHGMTRLWDKRMTEPVQAYYSKNCSSPVYSLSMDYGHLYLALEFGLNVLDFTAWKSDSWIAGTSKSFQKHNQEDASKGVKNSKEGWHRFKW